jgi:hypothetical protein
MCCGISAVSNMVLPRWRSEDNSTGPLVLQWNFFRFISGCVLNVDGGGERCVMS